MMRVVLAGVLLWSGTLWPVPAETGELTPEVTEPRRIVIGPDVRERLPLSPEHEREHRVIMLQHLEAVQAIVAALVEEDYERAQGITEVSLGFVKHREAMAKLAPAEFPPAYHDYAMAHHEAAEQLAQTLQSKDLKRILPRLDGLLKACVACHSEYTIRPIVKP
jgi:hypothetical protein